MAVIVEVTYEDGNTDEVKLRTIDLVKAERHYKGSLPAVEGSLYAAWLRLKPGVRFEDWIESLDWTTERREEPQGPLPEEPSPEE